MIDEKKIEEAAIENSEKLSDDKHYKDLVVGFKDGAKWAINEFLKDLWHDSKKEPEENRNILIEHKCGDLHYYTENYDCYYEDPWDVRVRILNITRWLYIDDLFPKEGDNHD